MWSLLGILAELVKFPCEVGSRNLGREIRNMPVLEVSLLSNVCICRMCFILEKKRIGGTSHSLQLHDWMWEPGGIGFFSQGTNDRTGGSSLKLHQGMFGLDIGNISSWKGL